MTVTSHDRRAHPFWSPWKYFRQQGLLTLVQANAGLWYIHFVLLPVRACCLAWAVGIGYGVSVTVVYGNAGARLLLRALLGLSVDDNTTDINQNSSSSTSSSLYTSDDDSNSVTSVWSRESTNRQNVVMQYRYGLHRVIMRVVWVIRRVQFLILAACCRVFTWALGFDIEVVGKAPKGSDNDAPIIVCNHQSIVEPAFFIHHLSPHPPYFVADDGVQYMMVFGTIAKALSAIFVRHKDPDNMARVRMVARRAGLRQILIFPEGVTTFGQMLLDFKVGAFALRERVKPVAIMFGKDVNPSWVKGGPSLVRVLYSLMIHRSNPMRVEFLETMVPSEEEVADPSIFAERVRETIAARLKVPMVSRTALASSLRASG